MRQQSASKRDLLTPRELEVLLLIAQGYTNRGIANKLGISFSAAKWHVSEILSKLCVETRDDAVHYFVKPSRRWSMISPLPILTVVRDAVSSAVNAKLATPLFATLAVVGLGAGTLAVDQIGLWSLSGQSTTNEAQAFDDGCNPPSCIRIEPQRFTTIEEVAAVASFGPRLPAEIPSGFEPKLIEHMRPDFGGTAVRASHNDTITVRYEDPNGNWLEVSQGFPAEYSSLFAVAPDKVKGTTQVGAKDAHWIRGTPGPGAPIRSEGRLVAPSWNNDGALSLSWTVDTVGDGWAARPDGSVQIGSPLSYSVSSNALSLPELVAIAESVP